MKYIDPLIISYDIFNYYYLCYYIIYCILFMIFSEIDIVYFFFFFLLLFIILKRTFEETLILNKDTNINIFKF